jgi:hypothetical protein
MDPYIHTLIATGLLIFSFYLGRFFGKEAGILHVWGIILEAFDAKEIELNEEGSLIVTYNDDSKETLN